MTVYAQKLGVAGTVIDGVCPGPPPDPGNPVSYLPAREVYGDGEGPGGGGGNQRAGFRKRRPREAGHLLVGDDSGVVVVPYDRGEEVLRAAVEIEEAEQKILEMLDKGITMREARKKLGYHQLQQGGRKRFDPSALGVDLRVALTPPLTHTG